MGIDDSKISGHKVPNSIKNFLKDEIRAGKLVNLKIAKIEMQLPFKDNEFQGSIYLANPTEYPILFTILEGDSEFDKYVLNIPIQFNG